MRAMYISVTIVVDDIMNDLIFVSGLFNVHCRTNLVLRSTVIHRFIFYSITLLARSAVKM